MRKIYGLMCCICWNSFAAEQSEKVPLIQMQESEEILDLSKSRRWRIKDKKDGVAIVDRHTPLRIKIESAHQKDEEYEDICLTS